MPMTYSIYYIFACIRSDGAWLSCSNSSSGTLTGAIGSGRIKFSSRPYECVTRKKNTFTTPKPYSDNDSLNS